MSGETGGTNELVARYAAQVRVARAYAIDAAKGAPTSTFEIMVQHFAGFESEFAAALTSLRAELSLALDTVDMNYHHCKQAEERAEAAETELERETIGNFEAVPEQTENDNFHTSIYEADYNGLLIARCNQNGNHPYHAVAILRGLNGKKASADLLSAAEQRIAALVGALTGLTSVIKAAGLTNLANGVQLGQTSWFVKATDALERADAALATEA